MPSNIEIKARVADPALVRNVAAAMADEQEVIRQEDTFFRAKHGRLKLRKFSSDCGELIHYERPDESGPKQSQYSVCRTQDPDGMCRVLTAALGVVGVVRKTRHLFLVGQTRIHLDEVEHLGHFLELEVVLQPGQSIEDGVKVAQDLMRRLGIREEDLIDKAYVDLLKEQGTEPEP